MWGGFGEVVLDEEFPAWCCHDVLALVFAFVLLIWYSR